MEKQLFIKTKDKDVALQLKNLGYKVYDLGAFSEIDLPKEK